MTVALIIISMTVLFIWWAKHYVIGYIKAALHHNETNNTGRKHIR